MGEIADMMLDGVLCSSCGVYMDGEDPGYPRECSGCRAESAKAKKKAKKEVKK